MLLSVVLPVYNEQEVLPRLFEKLPPVLDNLGMEYELLFINDGSRDKTLQLLHYYAQSDSRIKVLSFSRNFGQQAGITAGLDFALGDVVVVMDADLQDPPEMIEQMLAKFREGFDVVSTRKMARDGESVFKKWTATAFYRFMQKTVDERLPAEVGDFRLFSRGAVDAIRQFREQHRFMRGLVAWLGLKEFIIPFQRPARVAGETKYSPIKLVKLAWTAISSFSALPLKLSLYGGLFLSLVGVIYSIYAVYAAIFVPTTAPGWSSLVCFQLLFNGATLTAVGLVGDYVGRIYDESKNRPLYVLDHSVNLQSSRDVQRVAWIHSPEKSDAAIRSPAHSHQMNPHLLPLVRDNSKKNNAA